MNEIKQFRPSYEMSGKHVGFHIKQRKRTQNVIAKRLERFPQLIQQPKKNHKQKILGEDVTNSKLIKDSGQLVFHYENKFDEKHQIIEKNDTFIGDEKIKLELPNSACRRHTRETRTEKQKKNLKTSVDQRKTGFRGE